MQGRNVEYWQTLEKLLDSKMQADYEETLQDDLADMGKDIINFVSANNARIMARLAEIEHEMSKNHIKQPIPALNPQESKPRAQAIEGTSV